MELNLESWEMEAILNSLACVLGEKDFIVDEVPDTYGKENLEDLYVRLNKIFYEYISPPVS